MRYIYLTIGIIFFITILILYFQNIGQRGSFDFFADKINAPVFTLYIIIISFLSGVLITLSIKGFLDKSKDMEDDSFNL